MAGPRITERCVFGFRKLTMARVVVVVEEGAAKVLTDSAEVQVFVVDRDVQGTDERLLVEGEEAAVDCLLEGVPKVDAPRVAAIFDEVGAQLAPLAGSRALGPRGRTQLAHLGQAWFKTDKGVGPANEDSA